MKKMVGTICAALIAVFMTAAPANAKVCEEEVFATGKASLTKVPGAYFSSLRAWRSEADARYGRKFRAWRNATERNIDCAKGKKDGKSGWICTRTARPCRLGSIGDRVRNIGSKIKDKFVRPSGLPDRTLRRGDQGEAVKLLQRMLNAAGNNLDADGNFGSVTKAAVIEFQNAENLDPDGAVGPATRKALAKYAN